MYKLHVYYDGESEWIIAESLEEAIELWRGIIGCNEKELPDDELNLIQEPDDKELSITFEDNEMLKGLSDNEANELLDEDSNIGLKRIKKSCEEWAKECGKGLLCSSEY